MKNSQLKGLSVISIAEGKALGTVARVFFDPVTQQAVGFEVHQGGGLLSPDPDRRRMIDVEQVQALGPDALMVADESALRSQETAGPSADLVELDALTSRRVVAEGGTQVGAIASTDIDERTFHLRSVEISPGFFQTNREIPADQVVSIGSDVLVVTDAVCAPAPASDAGSPAADAGRHFVVIDERNRD